MQKSPTTSTGFTPKVIPRNPERPKTLPVVPPNHEFREGKYRLELKSPQGGHDRESSSVDSAEEVSVKGNVAHLVTEDFTA